MWEYDEDWQVYKLTFDDFCLAITEKMSPTDNHSAMAISKDNRHMYVEHGIDDLETAKETALTLYSKASGRSMPGIRREMEKGATKS